MGTRSEERQRGWKRDGLISGVFVEGFILRATCMSPVQGGV